MTAFSTADHLAMTNKGKHLKHIVCCVTVPCGLGVMHPRRPGEHKVTEKLFAFSGLTFKGLRFLDATCRLSLPPLTSNESCINGRHASTAPRAAVSPD